MSDAERRARRRDRGRRAPSSSAALAAIADKLPKGALDDALVIVNPSLSPRPLRLTLDDGDFVAADETVPPLGVTVVSRAALTPPAGLSIDGRRLENAHAAGRDRRRRDDRQPRPQAHATRGARRARQPALGLSAGQAARLGRVGRRGGLRRARRRDGAPSKPSSIVENGPHRVALRVERSWRSSRIVQTYALAANGRRLDIETFIDWRDRRVLLRSLTPAAVRAERATFECAFGVVTRPTHRNTSWDEAKFEVAGHRFADLAEPGFGLALLNDAKYGHSARDNVLGLSLVRSPVLSRSARRRGRAALHLRAHAACRRLA